MMAEVGVEPSSDRAKQVIEGFCELPPYPDVRPAFEYLHAAGVPIVTLTNGSEKATRSLLEKAGLDVLVRKTLSIDDVKHWKPAREVYLYAARALGIEPRELALVAVHAWDIQGAHRAGLTTGWVIRQEKLFLEVMDRPDVEGASVDEVVRQLVP